MRCNLRCIRSFKSYEEMYAGINEPMTNLHFSLEDTRKYKETMSELTTNLASLNTVYGNMPLMKLTDNLLKN